MLSKEKFVDVLREVPIYVNNRQKVDWLFNDSAGSRKNSDRTKVPVLSKPEKLHQWIRRRYSEA